MRSYQLQLIQVRVDQGVMAMKGYSTFPKAPGFYPEHQRQFSVIPRTCKNIFNLYEKFSQCSLNSAKLRASSTL